MIGQCAGSPTHYPDPFETESVFLFGCRGQERPDLSSEAQSALFLENSLFKHRLGKQARIGKPDSAIRRLFDPKFPDDLKVSDKTVINHNLRNGEGVFS